MIETPDPRRPLVEPTVVAKVKPPDVDVVKQALLDRIGALVSGQGGNRLPWSRQMFVRCRGNRPTRTA